MSNSGLSLDECILETKACIDLLIDNRYLEAIKQSAKHADESLYHSHCHSLLLFFKAYLSLEAPEIVKAQEVSEKTLKFCDKIRPPTLRDNFFIKLFLNYNYDALTEDEIHAELIRAEQIVFGTLMEFIVDQSLLVLVKVSYRLRSTYMMYKSFGKSLDSRDWSSDISYNTFLTGVRLGQGLFNLVFSLMPERLMNLLSVVGFQGSKLDGLEMLKEASLTNDFRSFAAQIVLCSYECYADQMFNVQTVLVTNTKKFIQNNLSKNSLSIWFLAFKGRLSLIEHNIDQALHDFESCLLLNNLDVKQLVNAYYWEIVWCHALLGNWKKAICYTVELRNICKWSPPSFYYLEAAFRIMDLEVRLLEGGAEFERSAEFTQIQSLIQELLLEAPRHVKRYAGKRIPMEKFVCEKVIKFQKQGRLIAPAYELFMVWNHLIYVEGKTQLIEGILRHIELSLKKFKLKSKSEDYLLLTLIKGACFRLLKRYPEAQSCLLEVVNNHQCIVIDKHLYSFAALELGIVYTYLKEFEKSCQWLIQARNEVKGEPVELIIQFRVFKAFGLRRELKKNFNNIAKSIENKSSLIIDEV